MHISKFTGEKSICPKKQNKQIELADDCGALIPVFTKKLCPGKHESSSRKFAACKDLLETKIYTAATKNRVPGSSRRFIDVCGVRTPAKKETLRPRKKTSEFAEV